ncbi:molybdenum cofactor biosynthesis protein, partial [Candidatus Aerophobetes bacterium]
MKIGIITVSDRSFKKQREDLSGPLIKKMVSNLGEVVDYRIVPDDRLIISRTIRELIDEIKVDLVLTTGGTGLSSRDVTPEATEDVIEKTLPGFGEIIRVKGFEKTPHALLSRAIAGVRKKSLVI